MEYECINCSVRWGHPESDNDSLVSSGLCPLCFRGYISLIHKRQCREGAFACFGKADDFCDQVDCSFRFACLSSLIEEWKKTIIKD